MASVANGNDDSLSRNEQELGRWQVRLLKKQKYDIFSRHSFRIGTNGRSNERIETSVNMIRLVSRSVLEHEICTHKHTQTYTENLQIEQGSFFDLGEAIERRQS